MALLWKPLVLCFDSIHATHSRYLERSGRANEGEGITLKVYIVTEILSRELIGNLLLAALLASRGHIAIILSQEDAFSLSSGSISGTTIFHAKSIHYAPERIRDHARLRDQGFLLTSQDQETFAPHRNLASQVSERFCEENLELFERIYVWSDAEADEFRRQFPEYSQEVLVTGSPREDTWGKRFRPLSPEHNRVRKRILIVPSAGTANHRMRHWEMMAHKKSVIGPGTLPVVFDVMMEDLVDELRSQLVLCRLALRLADEFPDCDVVIQPKRLEILESWKQMLYAVDELDGTRENLTLETSRVLEESVHGADLVINSLSTAGIIALIGQVPLISIGPTFSFVSEIGMKIQPDDDFVSTVKQALADPEGFIDGYEVRSRKRLGRRVRRPTDTLAAMQIVKDLESLDSENGISKLTYRDFLLYFAPGSVRRAAAAIKSLLTLKLPVRPFSEMVMTVSQSRVNDLLDRLCRGLGANLAVKASVAGGRSIIVRPGHGA